MARDMGRFVAEARRAIDDFKEEITAAGEETTIRKRRISSAHGCLRRFVSTALRALSARFGPTGLPFSTLQLRPPCQEQSFPAPLLYLEAYRFPQRFVVRARARPERPKG